MVQGLRGLRVHGLGDLVVQGLGELVVQGGGLGHNIRYVLYSLVDFIEYSLGDNIR